MTCVIVNDASCLIDLRKGGLLGVVCDLPYILVVPLPVRISEVLDLSEAEWQALDEAGMVTHDLTPEEIGRALAMKVRHPGLSANDCFCLITASVHPGILLTGDALLRRVAAGNGMRVHGVLWVVDELADANICNKSILIRALRLWQSDESVFLPPDEISARLKHLAAIDPRRGRHGQVGKRSS